jgi:hypothetical protein
MRKLIMAAAGSALLLATPALADGVGMGAGMAGGAAAGAVIGGPVGAAIGGAAGGLIGAAVPPREVDTYVVQQPAPSVTYQGDIVVGEPLPEAIVVQPVPRYQTYSYAVVNGRHVIVDAGSRKVVRVID